MDYSLCSLNDFCSVVKPVVKVAEDGKLPTKKFIPDFWNIMKHWVHAPFNESIIPIVNAEDDADVSSDGAVMTGL